MDPADPCEMSSSHKETAVVEDGSGDHHACHFRTVEMALEMPHCSSVASNYTVLQGHLGEGQGVEVHLG